MGIEQDDEIDAINEDEDEDDEEDDDDDDNDEDDDDDWDNDHDEEDEDEEDKIGLSLTVPNDDPELHTFLGQIVEAPGNRGLLGIFADKLGDRADPRSELVRDLATPGVYPEEALASSSLPAPMVAARFWAVHARRDRVHAAVYPATDLHRLITAATKDDRRTWPRHRPATVVAVRAPVRGEIAEGFQRALDTCRVRLTLALFGTSPEKLERLRVVKTSTNLREVKDLLYGRQRADTIPWMTAVYKSDRRRFTEVLSALLEDPALRHLGCEIMDAVEPEWPALLASRLTDRL